MHSEPMAKEEDAIFGSKGPSAASGKDAERHNTVLALTHSIHIAIKEMR